MSERTVTAPAIPASAGADALVAAETGDSPPPVRRRRGPLALLRLAVPPFLLFAAVIGLWYLVSYKILDASSAGSCCRRRTGSSRSRSWTGQLRGPASGPSR